MSKACGTNTKKKCYKYKLNDCIVSQSPLMITHIKRQYWETFETNTINYSAASVNKNMRTQIDKEPYKYELCDYPNREIISVMPQMKYRWKKTF